MIKLYSTHCPRCRTLEMKLDRAGIEYEVCDDVEIIDTLGFKSAPILETEEGLLDFSQAIKWVNSKA